VFGVADYWAFVAAVIVFLAIPGVGNLAIITSTTKGRIVGGLAATLGVIVADQMLMWLAVAGVAALLAAHPGVFGLVQYAGALYLAYLGVRMILARPGAAQLRIQLVDIRSTSVRGATGSDPAWVWDEAENRLHTQKALIEFLLLGKVKK
jgi:threonine/homoserine/homoserine lactone efflux protein